jgi:DNA-binding LytR/AlgR family response regulator
MPRHIGAAAFDVVFSDGEMAGMRGLGLAARLQITHPALPVVLTGGYRQILYEHGLPINDLLHKPYSVVQLAEVIKRKTQGEAVSA